MDEMVLEVQDWLNTTYGGNSSYTKITEDGITGGTTIAALITALQIELGISPVDGSFGPATLVKCPTLSSTSGTKNEIIILQGALYCKGYNPNGIDGVYGNGVIVAIKQFQADAGLSTQDGITTPTIFQAILNTDAYTLISGGDSNIRTIEQKLNNSYSSIIGLIPTNGLYSKSTNIALIKALQHEEGQSVDGLWGPSTMNACPTIPGSKSTKNFVLLLQYSLYCNGYNPNGFDGLYGNGVKTAVTNFQTFVGLTADGYAGTQVWSSLLVSYGDKNRTCTACDCSTTITSEIAQTLRSNGYSVVGRYLTGKYAMSADELSIIFANGLKVFPIFEYGNTLSYFNYNQGVNDAINALLALSTLGFENCIVYFAVDYDALDSDVTTNILPYFKAINGVFARNNNYKIGVYGPRNICSRVAAAGYSVHSFVSDMSSGFSGNIGYKLPTDWSFDQINTVAIGTGSEQISIDKDICKGVDFGVSSVQPDATEALVNLANKISSLFKITVTDLNDVLTFTYPNGIVVTWEVGLKSDIGSGDLVVYVDKGGFQSFESIVGAISGSTGLSDDWFNQLAENIYIGNIRFVLKGDLSVEIEIDQLIPDEIKSLMSNEGMSSTYLYTIVNIKLDNFISGLEAEVVEEVEKAASIVFELAALVIAVCAILEVGPFAAAGGAADIIGTFLTGLFTKLSNSGLQAIYSN
ncbi:Peptidoglycan-binding (PGRP) domain of peptidoglycan hydrolases-containing protein [Clostridium acidisoli DSM 12555]|uniref:Peptidoglycan-binding (PGRP) domain of peptidoglycan hydrolases-containing protein n=1 Tax=Clostridium acidisoli DSM 12555 TaxID=1121291 RepID=A0A1W1XYR9_9CLOT|nr:glycoside hydrolase domain-containing protein [Clostridium acidisoli]SMC29109.1 Peptidoglycan-binding (PGRP) domain of peptidoglycan hydrolases-containing protein [Clostridium acidisoli DSM 12555]